jgi:hypothetical protein
MELKALAVGGAGVPCAQNAVRDFSWSKVRLGLLDDAAQRLENVALRIDGSADANSRRVGWSCCTVSMPKTLS